MKNFINELIFPPVTDTTYFEIRFCCYEFLKSDFHTDQVLDIPLMQVLGQIFGLQDE
jgi:hypothetical protein